MNKNAITLILALSLGLSACGSPNDQVPLSQAPLAGAAIGGPFTLTDQDGKQRSYSEFDGKYRIIYFGYTNCPDICTPDLQHLMAGLSQFEKANPKLAGKVQPLFITVDPQRDTPAILKQFVTAFHPRLIGLTGSEDQIAAAAKSFAVYYQKMEGSSPDAYLMSHSQTPFLMGPDGKPLALMPADTPNTEANEGDPKLVVAELTKWVR
ncbi:MAG: SCO family protein [Pseudomonadota bacterium]